MSGGTRFLVRLSGRLQYFARPETRFVGTPYLATHAAQFDWRTRIPSIASMLCAFSERDIPRVGLFVTKLLICTGRKDHSGRCHAGRPDISSALLIGACRWLLIAILAQPGPLRAEPISVRYPEGTTHGFLALRTMEGKLLASGDLTEVLHGNQMAPSGNNRVIGRLTWLSYLDEACRGTRKSPS